MNESSGTRPRGFSSAWENARTVALIVFREAQRKQEGGAIVFIAGTVFCLLLATSVADRPEMTQVVAELSLAMIWLVTIALSLGLATRQMPDGFAKRTLPLLLSKPIRRTEYLWGLAIGCGITNAAALAVCYFSFGLGMTAAGGGHWLGLGQGILLHWSALTLFSCLALVLSVWRISTGLNMGLCLLVGVLMLLAARPLHDGLGALAGSPIEAPLAVIYYLLPHFELLDARDVATGGRPPASAAITFASMAYALCASTALLKLGEWRFDQQPLQSE